MRQKNTPPAPWYQDPSYWYSLADSYISASTKRSEDSVFKAELDAFREFNIAKVIFESNLIEGAGLPLGETRRVIQEHFPVLPASFDEFYQVRKSLDFESLIKDGKILPEVFEAIKEKGFNPDKFIPSISMSGKQRSVIEVLQHYTSIILAMAYVFEYEANLLNRYFGQLLKREDLPKGFKEELQAHLKEKNITIINFEEIPAPVLFAQDRICAIHKRMANRILPKDAKVEAGEYRIDNRIVGWDIVFPSPELIPLSMAAFIKRSNDQLDQCFRQQCNMYQAAASISYDFVSIHPFPDYNGRVSRVIMNMVLLALHCPFPISLKGTKKERHKYFSALRKANKGNLDFLSSLIANSVVETFQELDKHLERAELPKLLEKNAK